MIILHEHMKLSLIIPAYNEEARIGSFLDSIAKYFTEHPEYDCEVIVVDDGSRDDTVKVSQQSGKAIKNFTVISLPQNQGKGAAVRAGVMAAKGDSIIFMDADGATGIDQLPKMIHALESCDIAIGNRWMEGSQTERHSALRALSGFLYRNYMRLFGLGNIDTMCGFKGYQSHVAKDLYENLQEKRWLFDTEIAYKAVLREYTICNFPIAWESKDGSKLDTKTLITSALSILPLILKIRKLEKS